MLQQRADELLRDGPVLVHDVGEEAWHPALCRAGNGAKPVRGRSGGCSIG